MFRLLRFLITHGIALVIGFALGIYMLPILTAPEGPSEAEVANAAQQALFTAEFTRDLAGSDFLHWGEGEVTVSPRQVTFMGSMAPGPDYMLYLTRELVLDEPSFLAVKADSARIGAVKTFDKFVLDIPPGIDPNDYSAVVVWCESFSEFITAASYR
jgi:hypothetical protein